MGEEGLRDDSREIFRGLASSYDRTLDVATLLQDRRWKSWVLDAVGVESMARGRRVLDVGCGTLVLEEDFGALGADFVGVDLSGEMLAVGRTKSLPRVALAAGDAEALPFADGTFDAAVSLYVAKYVKAGRLVCELARVVRPGGAVALYDFARPTGPLAPALWLYVYGGLRAFGSLMGLAGRSEASTFTRLPGIIRRTDWSAGLEEAMRASGLLEVRTRRFAGGMVRAYSATKAGDAQRPSA